MYTGFGVAELVIAKSACVADATVTVADAVAPPGFGFATLEFALAVFTISVPFETPVAFTFTTSVNVAVDPLASDAAKVHVSVPAPPAASPLQPNPVPLADTNVVPVGVVSVIATDGAAAGPLFVTTIVYVMLFPADTVGAAATFVSVRYADVVVPTTVVAVAVLFVRFGSVVPEVMFATSTICVPNCVPAFTVTAKLNDPSARDAKSAFVHVTSPVDKIDAVELHAHPVGGVIEEKVVLFGIASLNTAFSASNGPAFPTPCVYVIVPPGATGLGVSMFDTFKSAPAQNAPDCVPGVCVIVTPEAVSPVCPIVAPYASFASVVVPGIPGATLTVPAADEVNTTPPPPPPPGP